MVADLLPSLKFLKQYFLNVEALTLKGNCAATTVVSLPQSYFGNQPFPSIGFYTNTIEYSRNDTRLTLHGRRVSSELLIPMGIYAVRRGLLLTINRASGNYPQWAADSRQGFVGSDL